MGWFSGRVVGCAVCKAQLSVRSGDVVGGALCVVWCDLVGWVVRDTIQCGHKSPWRLSHPKADHGRLLALFSLTDWDLW